MSKILALIPARAGSKGVKSKNIRELAGKPLIAYTIMEAIKSNIFEDIIVSTDSEKIADIARKYGANVPFLRPKKFALDDSSTIDVIIHCFNFMRNIGKEYQEVILLQPTSPLRRAHHIKEAYQLFNSKNADFIISVCKCGHPPLWANTMDKDLKMDNFIRKEVKNMRRQDLPQFYQINGALYLAKVDKLIEEKGFLGKNSYAYIMSRENSIDIDTEIDFRFCEVIMGAVV
ncbi:CMP-N-acetlyneuraminic acid synthetase [Iocasia frigidifontis]|uniref:CMP-N-acetlyneuraminic acid synthetase n=1 Tax=Iocasia fonsfrigidae TaxID=2682810 RepID=A0A8A7K8C5_9FIRM|nr:acylneuraminate cytidylyltransferase family protein [Iocasia fonsfrigidae]QTL97711.1 CMP-N-acetlyneuraminic acid synthetase [Iocasia fonsfrigidae]